MARPRRRARPGFPTTKRSKPPPSAPSQPCAGTLRPYAQVLTSPARAARETAQALGFDAEVETALRDCDYGRWRGLASKDVAEREPDAFAAWLGDPASAPHGGESVAALIERVGAWLTQALAREGATLAVTHASVVRAAIVNALGAGPRPLLGSMSRRSPSRGSAVMPDAGISWRSGLWRTCREGVDGHCVRLLPRERIGSVHPGIRANAQPGQKKNAPLLAGRFLVEHRTPQRDYPRSRSLLWLPVLSLHLL